MFAHGADPQVLARRLGRTPDALRLRAANMGFYRPSPRRRWSSSEDAAIRDGYDSGLSCTEIASELPARSVAGVAARARQLGLATHARRWTAADEERLRRLPPSYRLEELTRLLGRTPDAIRQRARKLGVVLPSSGGCPRAGAAWTADEDELLHLHPGLNPAVLAQLLGRSDRAVTIRLAKLGLRAGRERSPHRRTAAVGRLSPGEQVLLRRELSAGAPLRLVLVARRLGLPVPLLAAAVARTEPPEEREDPLRFAVRPKPYLPYTG